MPEASVDEDYCPIFSQYNVGCARQALHVHAVAEPSCKEVSPHQHLRLCVLASYAGHASVSLFWRKFVGHYNGMLSNVVSRKVSLMNPLVSNLWESLYNLWLNSNSKARRKSFITLSSSVNCFASLLVIVRILVILNTSLSIIFRCTCRLPSWRTVKKSFTVHSASKSLSFSIFSIC